MSIINDALKKTQLSFKKKDKIPEKIDAIITDPVIIYDGRMAGFKVTESETASLVTVEVASHWADFDKTAGRRTNTHSQQLHFPNDTGFQFAGDAINDFLWGRTA